MSEWRQIFESEGELREVNGKAVLLLDDPDSVWLVTAGRVDLFTISVRDGETVGARTHHCRMEIGQLLFGCLTAPDRPALLAVGIPGSRAYRLSRQRFLELAAQPEHAAQLSKLVGAWVSGLTSGAVQSRQAQRITLVSVGKSSRIAAGDSIGAARELLWIRATDRPCDFLSRPEFAIVGEGKLFPLAGTGWITPREVSVFEAVGTEDIVTDPAMWSGLDCFYVMVLELAAINAAEAIAAEQSRMQQRQLYEGQLTQVTLSSLAAVGTDSDRVESATGLDDNAIVAVCRLVGERLGVRIQAPAGSARLQKLTDSVEAIARASRIRVRRVVLSGHWWNRDNGPLVAFRQDGGPVALLPVGTSGYEIVDPAKGTREPLTADNASSLQAFAHVLYRSLGSKLMSWRRVLSFGVVGTAKDWVRVSLLGFAGGVLGMIVPLGTGVVFDRIIPGADQNQLLLLVLGMTVAALAGALFQLVEGIAFLRIETKVDADVEAGVWDRLLNLPTPFFRNYTAGDLAYRIMGISQIRQALTGAAISSLLSLVFALTSFVLMFYYDTNLALLAVAMFLTSMLATFTAASFQLRYERQTYQLRGKIGGLVLQLVSGISRLRVAAAENRALAVWTRMFVQQRRLSFRARSIANWLASFDAALPVVSLLLLYGAVTMFRSQPVSLGTFLAFSAVFTQLLYAAVGFSGAISSVLQIVPLWEQVKPILETAPEGDNASTEPGDLTGDIEVSHASFRYQEGGPIVLDDVSVHIRPGEFVAFVGPSGAGKSTLLRMMLGFDTPTTGSLYFDRQDLATLNVQAVRRQIGTVLQNGKLMPGDLFTNIIGSALLTLDDAWEAARMSGLAADIEQMPMGMHTVLNDGETALSGGQKQRLMIARAIVSRPKILFFDEATSALDNATQAQVSRSLEQLKATRVVIAHRLSTIQNADRIYVMEAGKIVQQGSYAELLEQPGLFADLAKRQML